MVNKMDKKLQFYINKLSLIQDWISRTFVEKNLLRSGYD